MTADDAPAPDATDGAPTPGEGVPVPLGGAGGTDINHSAAEVAAGDDGDVADAEQQLTASDDRTSSAGVETAERAAEATGGDAQPPLRAVLEAVLLVTDEPVPAVTLAQVAERPTGEVEDVLHSLAEEYAADARGFELRAVAGGWRLYTRADCAPYVERFVLDGQQARLTQAALETLAVIAYRQPVTRARVSAVRGVNVDGVVRTLVARGLVTEAGQDPESGATLYVTTGLLLEKLGLDSLDALPSLAPLLPELDDLPEGSMST